MDFNKNILWSKFYLLILFIITYDYLLIHSLETPEFITNGNSFKVVVGDTVILPCEVNNLGLLVIVWKRGVTLLTAGQQKITSDPRISLKGYNLQIKDIKYEDQGDYMCQIGDGSYGDLIHTLEILMPPTIQIFPNNEVVTTRKGANISLECRSNGNPNPTVQWSKKDGLLQSGSQIHTGYLLLIFNIQKQDSGIYQCTSSNGIGHPLTKEIKVHVLYPPEIDVLKSWVNSGESLNAKLNCIVHADPPSEVFWYQNSFPLQPTDRRTMTHIGKTYSLTIKNLHQSDFGNYSCSAINSVGKNKKFIELSGKPSPPKITSPAYSNPFDYTLSWTVQSVFPILEARILYRKVTIMNISQHQNEQWHDLLVNPAQVYNPSNGERLQTYKLHNLIPDTLYECLIQTKNQNGFGELSELHQWFTSTKGSQYVVDQISISNHIILHKSLYLIVTLYLYYIINFIN